MRGLCSRKGEIMSGPLTEKQKLILDYLVRICRQVGRPPTLREIGAQFGIRSTNAVSDHLRALERKGYLRRNSRNARCMTVLPDGMTELTAMFGCQIPLVGRVAAGKPVLAVENIEGTLIVEDSMAREDNFALRVAGESMIGEHIVDGDSVIVRPQSVCDDGDLVVVMVGDEDATLKRFYQEGKERVRLQPSNPQMQPIVVPSSEVRVIGKVVGLVRKM